MAKALMKVMKMKKLKMNSLYKMEITGDLAQAKCKSVTIILADLDVRQHVIKVM